MISENISEWKAGVVQYYVFTTAREDTDIASERVQGNVFGGCYRTLIT